MANVKHSAKNDSWQTPDVFINFGAQLFGPEGITLDPATSAEANKRIKAKHYFTKETDGLKQKWHGNIWLNPPGGKTKNKSLACLFWAKLMEQWEQKTFEQALFLCFSIEHLATSQKYADKSMLDFPICIPKNRIDFINPATGLPNGSPSHNNAIIYVPCKTDRSKAFIELFKHFGATKI